MDMSYNFESRKEKKRAEKSNKRIAIYCCGSLGREIYDIISQIYEDVIFIDDIVEEKYYLNSHIYKYEEFRKINDKTYKIIIASGEPIYRRKIYDQILLDGYELCSFVAENAFIGNNCKLGNGTVVFPNAYVAHDTCIEENVIIHAGALVEAECIIGKNSFISLGVFIGAETKIGNTCFIGPHATIRDSILIENSTIIGMASCVTNSKTSGVYVGVPAKKIREKAGLVFQ